MTSEQIARVIVDGGLLLLAFIFIGLAFGWYAAIGVCALALYMK